MPSKKRKEFEALSMTVPFSFIQLNMFEVADQYCLHVKELLKIVDNGGTAVTEITTEDEPNVLEVFRSLPDTFVVRSRVTEEETFYKPHEFLNWAFSTVPYMVMVGRDNTK
jgi:hypothetical protein